ncbi:hypothetical protein [Actinacidiphila soli]|uniref:hypothetical protein n=1 Tax=Actinacidiphila soli TaxID=2487275 RepID=UPI000FCB12CE|nr:hypothetical protein [Actinacidiphila soli]
MSGRGACLWRRAAEDRLATVPVLKTASTAGATVDAGPGDDGHRGHGRDRQRADDEAAVTDLVHPRLWQ